MLLKLKDQGKPVNLAKTDKVRIDEDGKLEIVKYKINSNKNTEWDDETLIGLGDWLYRHQKDFDDEQKQELRDIGYIFIKDSKQQLEQLKQQLLNNTPNIEEEKSSSSKKK